MRTLALFASAILALGSVAYAKDDPSNDKPLDIMRTCFQSFPATIDPRKSVEHFSGTVIRMIGEGLTELRPDGSIRYLMAESHDVTPDGSTYTFHLRDANWSDGKPVTAHDFEYSWKQMVNPKFGGKGSQLFHFIKNADQVIKGAIPPEQLGVNAADDKTLVVQLEHPIPFFLTLTAHSTFVPIPRHVEAANPEWDLNPGPTTVCNGPFRIFEWSPQKQIVLQKNSKYWNARNVFSDQIHISFIANANTTLYEYDRGNFDWLVAELAMLPLEKMKPYLDKGELKSIPYGATEFCSFNMRQFPFQNRNIRTAFSLSIDRNEITRTLPFDCNTPAHRCIPPVLMNYEDAELLFFDPPVAKKMMNKGLAELGIVSLDENGNQASILDPEKHKKFLDSLVLYYVNDPFNEKVAKKIVEQWHRAFGFTVSLEKKDFKSLLDLMSHGQYNMGLLKWIVHYPDAMNIFERFRYQGQMKNYPGFEHPLYNRLFEFASSVQNNQQRRQILEACEAIFIQEMPLTPLYHYNMIILAKPHVQNFEIDPTCDINFKSMRVNHK